MTQPENAVKAPPSIEEVQQGWEELRLHVGQLEAEKVALHGELKTLRFLLERVIEHRQKSHSELVLLITNLASKLPINDVGLLVAKLVEHNNHVSEILATLLKGKVDAALPQPAILQAMEKTKRDLLNSVKPLTEELIKLDAPFDAEMLRSLPEKPGLFFSPRFLRANRCYVKGQVARDWVVREFGDEALMFFNDMTTDKKLNPNPKPEEVALAFKSDFETLFQQNPAALNGKRDQLLALYQRIQRSKAAGEPARAQKTAFLKLTFVLELLHYYENQSTEPSDVLFAQRLPAFIEQLVVGGQDGLDEKLIQQAEALLVFIVNNDHRKSVVYNIGKGGGPAKTLKYILMLRGEKLPASEEVTMTMIPEFIKHLIPPQKPPPVAVFTTLFKLIPADMQRLLVRAIMESDRLRSKDEAEKLGKAIAGELGITGLEAPSKAPENIPPEVERQLAWEKVKELITNRADPGTIAAAIRARLHAKYESDEMKQSWVTLIEADPISFIRVFCQLPYLPDGKTDAIARAVMETYVTRLTHEKYAATYSKVMNSLKNMFKANPSSPTLVNFITLVKWVDAEAANKLSMDIGMPVAA